MNSSFCSTRIGVLRTINTRTWDLGYLDKVQNSTNTFERVLRDSLSSKHCVSPETSRELNDHGRIWNAGRIYATIMLFVTWLNSIRQCTIFDGKETLGADLFEKLATLPAALLVVIVRDLTTLSAQLGYTTPKSLMLV